MAREAARYSLRHVAREVGMSPNGLRDFLRGAGPRSSTRAKLERWLAGQGQVTRPPNVGQFIRLLNHLAVDLSPEQKTRFGRAIGHLLVESYEVRRLAAPRWVQSLLRHYSSQGSKRASEVA
jgi:transcriptional regulator with XRE-family HTH domain